MRENNVDQALKALKKKMQREGTFREMKRRNHFEKPSEKRARERAEAVRRTRNCNANVLNAKVCCRFAKTINILQIGRLLGGFFVSCYFLNDK